jgi:hypothetical protein
MKDPETSHSAQQREAPPPEFQLEGQSGETGWSALIKTILWFIIVPGVVLLLTKWFLQP